MLDFSMTPEMNVRVTPALLNLAHLLALPGMELQQAIQHELEENPALEEIEALELPCPRCGGPVVDGACLRCAGMANDAPGESSLVGNDDSVDPLQFVAAPRDLHETIQNDLFASLPAADHGIAEALLGSLDERGFLADDIADIAATLGVAEERVARAVTQLREVGPPGIATRDVRECLLAQIEMLAAEGISCPHAYAIVADHLDDLGARRHRQIARSLKISLNDVAAARDFIHDKLWPYPAQPPVGRYGPDQTRYRLPDLLVFERDDEFVVELAQSSRRMLRLNPLYQQLARRATQLEDDDRGHVQEYVSRARVFLANLRQRESTLLRVGEAIVARQPEFLRHGVRHLVPMTRSEIAAELGVHESTVSRATADKTIQLPDRSLQPLSELFVTARGVQDVLRELIRGEKQPLSDQELAALLHERGYNIARRTVAKYRDKLKIPPSHLRQ